MPKRNTYSSYSSHYGREKHRRIPSPVPYLLVALLAGVGLAYFHFLVFKSLQGKITNAYTGSPMAGIPVLVKSVQAVGDATPNPTPSLNVTATTQPDGTFAFDKLPPNPVLSVAVDGFTPQELAVADERTVDLKLVPNVLTGKVTAPDGKGVARASVWAGTVRAITDEAGSYSLTDIPAERKLVVKAPGYLSNSVEVGQVLTQDLTLEPFVARAIYMNADTIASPGKLQSLLDLIDSTELTAVVIDVKADNSGMILYDSQVPEVQQLGLSNQIIPDLNGLLASLREKKVYTIARLSVFWDQAITSAKPEWALMSKKVPGQPWKDAYGNSWSNPYMPEVWDYNISIAKEVASRGFNEVQFDNVQFPSDGELDDIEFGPARGEKKRVDAITGFLDRAMAELSPMGVYVGCNVFGLTPFVQDDMGVGQHFETVAAHTDYISPAIYPSNFGQGFMGFPQPAEYPAEVVGQTMRSARTRLGAAPAQIRPWLQDFSTKVQYDAPKVRAQIDAAEQQGAVGWMLWNFGNEYTAAALKGP